MTKSEDEFLRKLNEAPTDREKLKIALAALYDSGFRRVKERTPGCRNKRRVS